MYADDNLIDFYIAAYNKINSASPVSSKMFLYNAYTINVNDLVDIKFGIINFYTKTSNESNLGEYVPTMIRIKGSWDNVEKANANKLAVFF